MFWIKANMLQFSWHCSLEFLREKANTPHFSRADARVRCLRFSSMPRNEFGLVPFCHPYQNLYVQQQHSYIYRTCLLLMRSLANEISGMLLIVHFLYVGMYAQRREVFCDGMREFYKVRARFAYFVPHPVSHCQSKQGRLAWRVARPR